MERLRLSVLVKDIEKGGDIDVVIAADAQQAVERLERELMEANDRADRAVKDRAAVLDVKTKEGMTCSEWLMRTAKAEKEVDDLKQQVAQLREESEKLLEAEVELNARQFCEFAHEIALPGTRLLASPTDMISWGKFKEVVEALVTAHTTLRGLVHELMETWVNGRKVCDGIPLSLRERVEGALPREGGAQEPTERQIREMFMRGVKAAEADPKGGEHDQ